MSSLEIYNDLFDNSIDKIRDGKNFVNKLVGSKSDKRRGLTLVLRPDDFIKDNIHSFFTELQEIDPFHYYQPKSDLHITALTLISCYDGFHIDHLDIDHYIKIIKECLTNHSSFDIAFNGVSASLEAVIIQGFISNNHLNVLRNKLRVKFRNENIEQSIDTRYSLETAHITAVRFKRKIQQSEKYAAVLNKYRNHHFGTFQPKTLELVYNDWYLKSNITKILHEFHL